MTSLPSFTVYTGYINRPNVFLVKVYHHIGLQIPRTIVPFIILCTYSASLVKKCPLSYKLKVLHLPRRCSWSLNGIQLENTKPNLIYADVTSRCIDDGEGHHYMDPSYKDHYREVHVYMDPNLIEKGKITKLSYLWYSAFTYIGKKCS